MAEQVLHGTEIGDAGTLALEPAVRAFWKKLAIKKVSLCHCRLSAAGIAPIARLLPDMRKLKDIRIYDYELKKVTAHGLTDLYFPRSKAPPRSPSVRPSTSPSASPTITKHFEDVAPTAFVASEDNARGASFGDYDGDGDLDLYVANYGQANVLYRNKGDGTFEDVAAAAKVGQNLLGTAELQSFAALPLCLCSH